jgi:hypothetical protein
MISWELHHHHLFFLVLILFLSAILKEVILNIKERDIIVNTKRKIAITSAFKSSKRF